MQKFLISLIFIGSTAFAQSSISNFNYQGFFISSGQPFTGQTNMTFRIMDASAGGNELWTSPPTLLTVANGVYSYILGVVDGNTAKPFSGISWTSGNKWIEVVAGGVGVSPRTQLMAVPMAIGAFNGVPIGAILAWHKNFPTTPPLPGGWVECNGQMIDNPSSPYHGQIAPNLNTENRFLRGNVVSGGLENDSIKAHAHQAGNYSATNNGNHNHTVSDRHSGHDGLTPGHTDSGGSGESGGNNYFTSRSTSPAGNHIHEIVGESAYFGTNETRPANMSVVWIMRIN